MKIIFAPPAAVICSVFVLLLPSSTHTQFLLFWHWCSQAISVIPVPAFIYKWKCFWIVALKLNRPVSIKKILAIILPTGSHSESEHAAAVCDVWGPRPWGEPAGPGRAKGNNMALFWVSALVIALRLHLCRRCHPCTVAQRHQAWYQTQRGQAVTCGSHLLAPLWKCGNVFNPWSVWTDDVMVNLSKRCLKGKACPC